MIDDFDDRIFVAGTQEEYEEYISKHYSDEEEEEDGDISGLERRS